MHGVIDHPEDETLWSKVLVPFDVRETISPEAAAKRSGRTPRTIRNWCDTDGIGRKVGGRLRISAVALQMKLEGDYEGLALYRNGDRAHPGVVTYFKRLGIERLILEWRAQNLASPKNCGANHRAIR
jgi:hypothetical protein